MVVGAERSSVRLSATPDSVGRARAAVRTALQEWDLEGLEDTAMLLVSELATNVLLHARSDFEVRVERQPECVRVTVFDASGRRPTRRRYGVDAGTGRGLGLVETLASGWGTVQGEGRWSKGVWFQLPEDAGAEELAEGSLYGEDWLALVDDL